MLVCPSAKFAVYEKMLVIIIEMHEVENKLNIHPEPFVVSNHNCAVLFWHPIPLLTIPVHKHS